MSLCGPAVRSPSGRPSGIEVSIGTTRPALPSALTGRRKSLPVAKLFAYRDPPAKKLHRISDDGAKTSRQLHRAERFGFGLIDRQDRCEARYLEHLPDRLVHPEYP